jgi:hypothetical protein
MYLGVVGVCLQNVLRDIYSVHKPIRFQIVKGQAETDCTILLITHLERLEVVIGGIYVALLFFLDQTHIFLGFNHGFVVFQALYQLLLCQIVFVVGDEEVSE